MRKHLPGLYHESNTLVIQLIWKEAQLHAHWHELKQMPTTPIDRSELREILQSALTLNVDCQTWEESLPTAWKCHVAPNSLNTRQTYATKWQTLVLEGRGAPDEIHTFSNLKRYWLWMSHRTCRMLLLRDILGMLNWMLRMPGPGLVVSSPHDRMDSAQLLSTSKRSADTSTIISLDDLSLRILYNSITMQMVGLIEEGCSTVLGSLTVPVDKKSLEDVMGIKGYNLVWPLETMDSILCSGLVPDIITSAFAGSPSVRSSPPRQVPNVFHDRASPTTAWLPSP
jgi:hypothetical protein